MLSYLTTECQEVPVQAASQVFRERALSRLIGSQRLNKPVTVENRNIRGACFLTVAAVRLTALR